MERSREILLLYVLNFITACGYLTSGSAIEHTLTATDTPQYLTSPGYPLKYLPNTITWWSLVASDSNKVVVMETVDFMLHAGSKCDENQDSLIVFNDTSRGAINWTLCGQDRQMIISPGKSLFLIFTSDDQYEGKGFKLRYYQASARTPCNFDILASLHGDIFSSPGYPGGYFNNLECNYTIRTQWPAYRVEIEVIASDIEDATHCQYDRLTVVDQNNGTQQTLGTICGRETATYQSSGTSLQVQFVSNSRKVNKGFLIRYKSVFMRDCGFRTHATRMDSFLVSPGYPYHYYRNLTCEWGIDAAENRTMDVSVIKSNIAGYGPNCTGDKMEISDMRATNLDKVICGNQTPSFEIRQLSWVSLYTDGKTEKQGFLMRYHLQKENITLIPCGGKLEVNSRRELLQSPMYPDTLLVNQKCVWNLTAADPNEIIMLTLEDLDIEMSSNCAFDSLRIYNGSSILNSNVLETWCGQRGGEVIYITGPYLTIVYKVDDSNNGRGFSLTYSTVAANTLVEETSHVTAKDTVSYLTSPGFSNYFPRSRVFLYIFTAAVDDKIRLDVTKSSLPGRSNGTCTGGTEVIVYDGPTNRAPRLRSIYSHYFTWCGQETPLYISSNNSMLLEYHTGSQGDKDVGFELTYKQGSYRNWRYHECGAWLKATSTHNNLTSPQYPHYYRNNMLCRWVIQASTNGSMIRLTALDISLEGDTTRGRCFDSITVYDGSDTHGNRKNVWCGSMSKIFQTTGSLLTIVFKTDTSTTNTGFRLEYFETTEPPPCIQSLAVMSGTRYVKTPGYDQQTLPPNKTCTWIFYRYLTYNYYIKLDVMSLAGGVTNNQTCSSNRLEVYDGMTESSPLIGRFCGGDRNTYIGSRNTMLVKMVTGPSPVSNGFNITYKAGYGKECDDKYLTAFLSDNIITSPFYSTALYPNNMDCIWRLSSYDIDYIVMIEALKTDVEYSEGCVKDYIEVYDDYGTTSPIDKWCGTRTPKYQSTGEFLTIKFHTDSSVSKSGFKLKYWKKYQPYSSYLGTDTNVGAIVGGTLGGVVLAVIIIIVIAVYVSHKSTYRRPILTTAGPSYPQMVYQPGENRVYMNQQTAAQNMQGYSNNAYGGANSSYIASPTTANTGITGGKSALPEYSSVATGGMTPHHYEGIQSGTQANGGTKPDHPSVDNNDGSNSTYHSTNM